MYQPKIIDMQMGQEFETIARSLPRILEALGWHTPITTEFGSQKDQEFKLHDNHSPWSARLEILSQ